MFSHELLYKTLMFAVKLDCWWELLRETEYRQGMKEEKRKTREKRKERGRDDGYQRGEREMRERRCCPPGLQVGRFTWRGQAALQRGGTQQGLMEGLWFSTNFQLYLSTWQPPTRNGIITSRPPVSQISSEERSRKRPHSWWHYTPRMFLTWSLLRLL